MSQNKTDAGSFILMAPTTPLLEDSQQQPPITHGPSCIKGPDDTNLLDESIRQPFFTPSTAGEFDQSSFASVFSSTPSEQRQNSADIANNLSPVKFALNTTFRLDELEKTKSENTELKSTLETKNKEVEDLRAHLEKQEKKNTLLRKKVAKVKEKSEGITQKNLELTTNLQKKCKKLDRQHRLNKNRKDEIKLLRSNLQENTKKLKNLTKEKHELQAVRTTLEQRLQGQIATVQQLQTTNSELQKITDGLRQQLQEKNTIIQQTTTIRAAVQNCKDIDVRLKTAALHIDAEIMSAKTLMNPDITDHNADFDKIGILVSNLLASTDKENIETRKANIAELSKLANKMPGNVSWGEAIGGAVLIFIGLLLTPVLVGIPIAMCGIFAVERDQLSGSMRDFAKEYSKHQP